jgi:hypothetical protein
MPGPEGEKVMPYFQNGGWERVVIDLAETVDSVGNVSDRVLSAASILNAPIILYPFGPKIVVFCFGMLLTLSYPSASWAMYPVPRTHPITYSDGVGSTQWLPGKMLTEALNRSSPR